MDSCKGGQKSALHEIPRNSYSVIPVKAGIRHFIFAEKHQTGIQGATGGGVPRLAYREEARLFARIVGIKDIHLPPPNCTSENTVSIGFQVMQTKHRPYCFPGDALKPASRLHHSRIRRKPPNETR
jgi:hypothetical protein